MLIDSHIHVGQFEERYFTPSTIHELMEAIGADYYAVSSTTQCEENYPKVLEEIRALIGFDGENVLPVMWITPQGLEGNIAWYLESEIKWKMLKIHPFLNQTEWNPDGTLLNEVIDIARELRVPVLIHTGNEPCCNATLFEPVIKDNLDITFVLAHGRPFRNVMRLVKTYCNAYADSAFMPVDVMASFVYNDLSEKLLWGTDMYIPKHFFPEKDMIVYYHNKLNEFKRISAHEQFECVTFKNAMRVFGINKKKILGPNAQGL